MSSDTAVEEPRSLLGLRRNVLTSSRHGGDKDKKEPSDNPSSSKIKRVSVDAAFLISDQLRQLCSRQIPRPMNLLTLHKVFCHNWESSSEGLCSYAETLPFFGKNLRRGFAKCRQNLSYGRFAPCRCHRPHNTNNSGQ